jgi:hypothetical protein
VTSRNPFRLGVVVAVTAAAFIGEAHATNWNVTRTNHMLITPPGGVLIQEMSGVTYLGEPVAGNHRFVACMENLKEPGPGTKRLLLQFDVTFSAAGAITGFSNISNILINPALDFEGIAYTNPARHSVFLADEGSMSLAPTVREVLLSTGIVQTPLPAIPAVFANKRTNRGFESLTRSPDGTVMWTANEEALTVDGAAATAAAGTPVRLLKFDVAGNTATAAAQFAYQVEPIHGSSTLGAPQSGLSDLTLMPDGTLLALERSVVVGTPIFLNRIYETSFAGATDVSQGALANGLTGQSYTPVGKQLLWSGAADNSAGQNLEGLALGPRLANGSWVLLGVVDDNPADEDTLSANTVVAFLATANPTADFIANGEADGVDFLAWQRGFGKTVGAKLTDGDGDRDGDVDAADLSLWKAAFATPAAHPVPEPAALPLAVFASIAAASLRRRSA